MKYDEKTKGLTNEQAELLRRQYGSNSIVRKKKNSFLKQFMASFGDPIIKILLIALFINIIFMLRDFNWYESAGIAIAVLLATFVSTLSEYGSERAFEKLQEEAANIKCRVKRGGALVELPLSEIVKFDIVHLQAGERVPADGTIIAGELSVDQSALNGESKEAHKLPSADDKHVNADEGFMTENQLFRGSVVCAGEGIMEVSRVGAETFYGNLALEIQEDTIESPLKARLGNLAKSISFFGYAAAAVVVFANLFNNIVIDNYFEPALMLRYLSDTPRLIRDFMRALTLGITVIVMAVPEGLPMMITVVLSANMRRMLKDNVLVRKLVGIETSGSLNILFTDKTGTLTKGKLGVKLFVSSEGKTISTNDLKRNKELYGLVKLNCAYNNSADISEENGVKKAIGGNSTDRSLLEFVMGDSLPSNCEKQYTRQFNSKDKYSVTEIKGDANWFLIKGAPEILIPKCVNAYDEHGARKGFSYSPALKKALERQAADSVRLLALCVCRNEADAKELKSLTLTGFLGIRDEIREEVPGAIEEVTAAGVQVVMVTGDNKETALSVARDTGLIRRGDGKIALTSAELSRMSDIELKMKLPEISVIARALPSDKSRLIRVSQEMGLVTGMTGDGINDAPALKKADVGFAMGDGSEIAKEAGDVVILDNNFASIVKAISYGRTIFKSIRKFLIFQLTINVCAVGVSVIGPFVGIESPVTVIQMLWINMIMDTLAGLAYAGEKPLPEYMKEPPKRRTEKIINRYMYSQIISTGIYTTLLCLLFFKLPFIKVMFRGEDKYMLTAFFALFVFSGVFNSLNARTYRINLFSYILENKAFVFIMGAVVLIQLLMIYYGGRVFRTSGLRLSELMFVILLAATVICFDIVRKLALRANKRKGFI